MLHAFPRQFRREDFPPVAATPAASTILPPLTPAAYLGLCRKAAGVSIEQAAARIAPADMLDIAALFLRDLERPGTVAKYTHTLQRISYAFPFNLAVYRQLADQPAHRHPRICRTCGRTGSDTYGALGDAVRMVSAHACERHADKALATGQDQ